MFHKYIWEKMIIPILSKGESIRNILSHIFYINLSSCNPSCKVNKILYRKESI